MKLKGIFLQTFRKSLPVNCPVKFNCVRDGWSFVNVAESDGDVYFEIGKIISTMPEELQNWYDTNISDSLDEKLCDIFCREYKLEF